MALADHAAEHRVAPDRLATLALPEAGADESDGRTWWWAAAFSQRDEVWPNMASGIAKGQPSAT